MALGVAILVALVSLSIGTGDVGSQKGGILGRTETGCVCHSTAPAKDVTAKLDGLPDIYEPGKVYDLVVRYNGGPPAGPEARAGFNLLITAGQLSSSPGSVTTRISFDQDEATHSEVGNGEASWPLQWTAPEEGSRDVHATLVVNVVNGNGNPDSEDHWDRVRATSHETGADDGGAGTVLWVGLLLLVVLLAVVFLLGMRRGVTTRKPKPRKSGKARRKRRR